MFPFFRSDGNIPFSKQSLKMSPNGLHIDILQIGIIRMLILSWPGSLFGSRFSIIFNMSVFENFTVDKRSYVKKWSPGGSLLSLFRWGTHLYMSIFPSVYPSFRPIVRLSVRLSVRPSVAHYISGTLHHLIKIFWYTYVKWSYLQVFFSFFKKFWFCGC